MRSTNPRMSAPDFKVAQLSDPRVGRPKLELATVPLTAAYRRQDSAPPSGVSSDQYLEPAIGAY